MNSSDLPDHAVYSKRASDAAVTVASSKALWQVVSCFGSNDDYFSFRFLWWLRRSIDWLLSGPSFRRPRRDLEHLRVGDVVDAWRVIALQPESKLTLWLEMKCPGAGVLEFLIIPHGSQREVRVTAYFQGAGVLGPLYWYLMLPFHHLLFRGMTREIVRRALSIDAPRF